MDRTPLPLYAHLPSARLAPRARLRATAAWASVVALCGAPLAAGAQEAAALRASPQLAETIPEAARACLPVFVSGERMWGETDERAVVEGDAELRRGDTVIHADRLEYTVPDDRANATGKVRINRAGNIYEGSELQLHVDAFEGFFNQANYQFLANGAHGEAARVDFLDRDRAVVHDATYTTCTREAFAEWRPDWIIRAERIEIDQAEDVGTARNGVLEFKGVPILAVPYISFPLSDKRKSGLLPPTMGLDSVGGFEYSQPYYWNIAPNRDATLEAAVIAKRGVRVGGEFRYLEPTYAGRILGDVLPSDRLRERTRWSYALEHNANLATPLGGVGVQLNVRRVSDDDYWRDLGRDLGRSGQQGSTQRLLPADALFTWGGGDHHATLRTVKWQTLQDPLAPIVPPFDRLPQLQYRYTPSNLGLGLGLDASVELDTTRFRSDRSLTLQPNAQRSYALLQASRPFLWPAGFITPRLQLHASNYQFDAPLAGGARSANRTLPTFSLDTGLVFERDARFFNRAFVQTLEPRAFYTYTPYRDQSRLPVYDTAANDFNFATIYTENAYGGQDRIADNNLLTLGLTTRLLDPDTGAEAARFGIAQRLRFSDQDVTLPGEPVVQDRLSDLMLGASLNWTPQWGFNSTVQFNPKTRHSIRSTVGARYQPAPFHVISAAYRIQRGSSEQVDVGWQWPLDDLWGLAAPARPASTSADAPRPGRWYGVGRLNYSLRDRKLVDTVVGLEYDSCCWIGRVVLERLQNSLVTSNTRLLFQIEFTGFSRLSLGSNPLTSLRQNIPGYRTLGEDRPVPSRFSNYD
ncbi:MAG: LPS biosynthesis protein [Acidovorax sp. SCN 68-22]|nr:MAG: LPS biosynthesis protein [Acidovorax sp. SCN 68-22]